MQIAVYVIYELLVRLQELNPAVGEYISYKKINAGISVQTSTGLVFIPEHLLSTQFNNPAAINPSDLLSLLDSFKLSTT